MKESARLEELKAALSLLGARGVGVSGLRRLLAGFGSPLGVMNAPMSALADVVGRERAGAILSADASLQEEDAAWLLEYGAGFVTFSDKDYPKMLKSVPNAPGLLFYRGDLSVLGRRTVAIVGTRAATRLGRETANRLAQELARAEVTVVSGGARGIDSEAHLGALKEGATAVVLGSGFKHLYPKENSELFSRVSERGVVLTELPPQARPTPGNFPKRNRIISGISHCVVVVEGSRRSGALITATWALEQGREVMAVPGSPGSVASEGTNMLIKEGAKPVTEAADILEELSTTYSPPPERSTEQLTGEEKEVFQVLDSEPRHAEEIAQKLDEDPIKILILLLDLELKWMARQLPGKYFVRE